MKTIWTLALLGTLAVATSCMTVALPPPSMLPTDLSPVPRGAFEAGYGGSVLFDGKRILPNFLGGPLGLASLRWSLAEGLELGVRAGPGLSPWPTVGTDVGYELVRAPAWSLWGRAGLGGTFVVAQRRFCDGQPQDFGECEGIVETRDTSWGSLAPNIAFGLALRPSERWDVGLATRASYAFTIPGSGYSGSEADSHWWLEGALALSRRIGERWRAGLSLGLYELLPLEDGMPFSFAASVTRAF